MAREVWAFSLQTLANVWSDIMGKWFFIVADLVNGAAAYLAARHVIALKEQAKFLSKEAEKFLELARTAPAGSPASVIYRDLDLSRVLKEGADDAAASAIKSEANAGRIGFRVGGALSAAGVAYDIYNGKPVEQAVVSGAGGFGASLAAGALAGRQSDLPCGTRDSGGGRCWCGCWPVHLGCDRLAVSEWWRCQRRDRCGVRCHQRCRRGSWWTGEGGVDAIF
ncbi:hypothetical protein GS881_23320 [Rhodococcus hoagii]|nr:hypothetical protein [Prescottella equi]